jgi:multicomponent Na+:H+ antiporter subunit E
MGRAIRFLATTAAGWAIYLLLSMPVGAEELALGLVVAVLSAIVLISYLPFDGRLFNPIRVLRALVYFPWFVWKMIEANLQMAAIVIAPVLKILPSIVRAGTELESPEGKLVLTSSVTLTPGTLSVDVLGDQVYVHRVTGDKITDEESREELVKPFEKFIKGVTE